MADAESNLLMGFRDLIEQEVDKRVRPLEEALQQIKSRSTQPIEVEEYLDVEALATRIHKSPDTIRDWVYRRNKNGIPVIKMPTGGLMFAWSEFETWLRGQES